MYEQTKAAKRRYNDGNFHSRYFVGNGIDIGGRPDPFSQYIGVFPLVQSCKIWDFEDGDAQKMQPVADGSYDFLTSSHCLEHMFDVYEAMKNWIRIVKDGGYLVITIPDEDMYEQGNFPSLYNSDHKWTFTIYKKDSWSKKSINIFDLLIFFADAVDVEKVQVVKDFYDFSKRDTDQTLHPNVESCIEMVLRKKSPKQILDSSKDRFWMDYSYKVDTNFSSLYSKIYEKLINLKDSNKKYIIYGYGSFGKTIGKIFGEENVLYLDKSFTNDKVFHPKDIESAKFDNIIISVLGREDEIEEYLINELQIDKNKIVRLD